MCFTHEKSKGPSSTSGIFIIYRRLLLTIFLQYFTLFSEYLEFIFKISILFFYPVHLKLLLYVCVFTIQKMEQREDAIGSGPFSFEHIWAK